MSFVFTIAANLLRDRGRKAHPPPRPAGEIDEHLVSEADPEFVEDRDPERVLLARESDRAALRALDELGERTRDIYVLFRLEDMRQRQIAALYGVVRQHRGEGRAQATLHLALRFGSEGR